MNTVFVVVLPGEIEENFGLYKREKRVTTKKIIFGFIGMVAMISVVPLFPDITGPIINGIRLVAMLLFFIFFMYLFWALSQRPSAEKRIFANFYQSLKYLNYYKKERHGDDLKKAKKYLQKAVNLIKKGPPSEFEIVNKKIEMEINPPLEELAEKIESRLIASLSSSQIDKYLEEDCKDIENLAINFYTADLDKIKKINAELKRRPIIGRVPSEKIFPKLIRSVARTTVGLVFISVILGYISIVVITFLFSTLFGWELSNPLVGSSMIGGGAAISYIIYTAARGK